MSEMVLCPYCNKWVALEGHEHEPQIREHRARIERINAKYDLRPHGFRCLCTRVPVTDTEEDTST